MSTTAVRFTRAVVRDMSCRVERVEASLVTRDSGIRALFDVGTLAEDVHFGLLQDILEVSTAPDCSLGYCCAEVMCLGVCTSAPQHFHGCRCICQASRGLSSL